MFLQNISDELQNVREPLINCYFFTSTQMMKCLMMTTVVYHFDIAVSQRVCKFILSGSK